MAGGRHRFGVPREVVKPRVWDRHRRAEAEEINRQEAGWTVLYGPWSRMFWAFAAWPAPSPVVIDARTADGLHERMRVAEASLALGGGWS
jgi:hypothetical protein